MISQTRKQGWRLPAVLLAVVVVGTGMTPVKVWREDPDGKSLVVVTNSVPRAAAGAFRIMSYNIRFGKGMDDVTDYYIAVDKAHAGDFSVLRSYEIPDRFTSDHSPIAVDVMPK